MHGHHRHKKLKCEYEKIIRDEKNKYGYDELGQTARFNRHITCTAHNMLHACILCRRYPNPLGRMQSMPAVHQGGYVVKKLPVKKKLPGRIMRDNDDDRQKADLTQPSYIVTMHMYIQKTSK